MSIQSIIAKVVCDECKVEYEVLLDQDEYPDSDLTLSDVVEDEIGGKFGGWFVDRPFLSSQGKHLCPICSGKKFGG